MNISNFIMTNTAKNILSDLEYYERLPESYVFNSVILLNRDVEESKYLLLHGMIVQVKIFVKNTNSL